MNWWHWAAMSWWQSIQAEINKRLKSKCEFLGSAPPLQISSTIGTRPNTWQEFKVWLRDNLIWSGNTNPVQSGSFTVYGPRFFFDTFAAELGSTVGPDGKKLPLVRVNDGTGWADWVKR